MNRVKFEEFRRHSWEEACEMAGAFMSRLPGGRVISVAHVSEPPYARVFVWYAENEAQPRSPSTQGET